MGALVCVCDSCFECVASFELFGQLIDPSFLLVVWNCDFFWQLFLIFDRFQLKLKSNSLARVFNHTFASDFSSQLQD